MILAQAAGELVRFPLWELLAVLASFLGTMIALLGVIIKWMIGRMDKKDERFAKTTSEDRDKFLSMADQFIAQTEDRSEKFYLTAQAFNDSTAQFDSTVREFLSSTCEKIDELIKGTTNCRSDWEAIEEKSQGVLQFLTGDFLTGIKSEHELIIEQTSHIQASAQYVKAEHGEMIESLRLTNRALEGLCNALDIKVNGRSMSGGERVQEA